MVLYKYYGFNSGLSALKSSLLGFRTPGYFNDPFELSYLDNAEGSDLKLTHMQTRLKNFRESVVILSLTRTPLNPLMWAHYAEEHKGFVIGYQVDTPFLKSRDFNLIPIDGGDVMYTNTKTLHALTLENKELLDHLELTTMFPGDYREAFPELENLARKVFLVKHACWVYEEEVRVVKQSINFTEESGQSPMWCSSSIYCELAPGYGINVIPGLSIFQTPVAIKEVYLGLRNPLLGTYEGQSFEGSIDHALREKSEQEQWEVNAIEMTSGSWELKSKPLKSRALSICKSHYGLRDGVKLTGRDVELLKAKSGTVKPSDEFYISEWRGELYLKKNNNWVK
ncbi:DUF2971 domain-containing protein [Pseudomonas mandelii]|uniref:DUF2971 domain-containing protein n=1 Tax=Pseudomonas mandelii TaxID=75612 RepID=A0A502HMC9_9PSED|nr:DUF2971 domain-containing protein [Pseudomonas mandelii]TPG75907.1 DUF2971 domain-containing protein [Pseudomonas mandelii]